MPELITAPPYSLYVHIPWCVRKCPYCDFNSHTSESKIPEKRYLDNLLEDLKLEIEYFSKRRPMPPLSSIFFGGGTPSLLSAEVIERVILEAKALVGFKEDIEITLEANPGAIDRNKFIGLFQAGVNRLSIGVQSFNQNHLHSLGRIHSRDDALVAVDYAQQAGFTNFNLDLMFGLPNQKLDQALIDLEQAVILAPTHISWYQLTIEPNTAFYRQPPVLPEEETTWQIHEEGIKYLASKGYDQYEVSAYAQDNKQAQHNLNYWQFSDYLAIGAGAHGKCTNEYEQTISRHWKNTYARALYVPNWSL